MKITASTAEEFSKIENFVLKLPNKIESKVKSAHYSYCFMLDLDLSYENGEATVYIPNDVKTISHKDGFIRVDCPKCSFIINGNGIKIEII